MGHDDMHRKTTRYHPHAHDPMARTWANDFTNLALNPAYEKSAAPLSKRRNGLYMGVDKSAGSFYGLSGLAGRDTDWWMQQAVSTIAFVGVASAMTWIGVELLDLLNFDLDPADAWRVVGVPIGVGTAMIAYELRR